MFYRVKASGTVFWRPSASCPSSPTPLSSPSPRTSSLASFMPTSMGRALDRVAQGRGEQGLVSEIHWAYFKQFGSVRVYRGCFFPIPIQVYGGLRQRQSLRLQGVWLWRKVTAQDHGRVRRRCEVLQVFIHVYVYAGDVLGKPSVTFKSTSLPGPVFLMVQAWSVYENDCPNSDYSLVAIWTLYFGLLFVRATFCFQLSWSTVTLFHSNVQNKHRRS